jgi:hypothetical protein
MARTGANFYLHVEDIDLINLNQNREKMRALVDPKMGLLVQ